MEISPNIIDIDSEARPTVLAGLLNIPVPMVYQGRNEGKLPSNPKSTYRQCLHTYIEYYKVKSRSSIKSTNLLEKKVEQEIRVLIAKEEQAWLNIQKDRTSLIDKAQLEQVIFPIASLVRSGLVSLARKHPEAKDDINTLLKTWEDIGRKISEEAKHDNDNYIRAKLDEDIALSEEDRIKNLEDYDPE